MTGFQNHSLADSLSKRLYSAEKLKKEVTTDENFGLLAYHSSSEVDDGARLNDAIVDREKFKYGYWR